MLRIILRYTSIQSFKMLLEDFPLPSLSKLGKEKSTLLYMHKLRRRMVKYVKLSVSYLMKYLQKCEEYFGGEQIGSYENGEL